MTTFRIHFSDGSFVDRNADDPGSARSWAKDRFPDLFILKIKRLKETSDA